MLSQVYKESGKEAWEACARTSAPRLYVYVFSIIEFSYTVVNIESMWCGSAVGENRTEHLYLPEQSHIFST